MITLPHRRGPRGQVLTIPSLNLQSSYASNFAHEIKKNAAKWVLLFQDQSDETFDVAVADITLLRREKRGCIAIRLGPSTSTDRAADASISTHFGPSPRGGGNDARAEGNVSRLRIARRSTKEVNAGKCE